MAENFYGFEDKCQSLETGRLPAGIGKQECFTPVWVTMFSCVLPLPLFYLFYTPNEHSGSYT